MILRSFPGNPGQAALVAAILAAAAPAATLASSGLSASDAAQRTAARSPVVAVVGVSDAAQRTASVPARVTGAFGVSDAAQRGAADGVPDAARRRLAATRALEVAQRDSAPAGFGASDAAQRSGGPTRVTAALGVSGVAVRRALESSHIQSAGAPPARLHAAVVSAPRPATGDDGFDWGSAAIGAGGGLAVAFVATLGGAAALRPGRRSAGRPA